MQRKQSGHAYVELEKFNDLHIHCIQNATLSDMGPIQLHNILHKNMLINSTNGIIDCNNNIINIRYTMKYNAT